MTNKNFSTDMSVVAGTYMYIETSFHRRGDNAKLNSPKLQFGGSMCLVFYYHMYGADIATLNAMINGRKVFSASGNKGDMWLRAAVDVHVSGIYAVRNILALILKVNET